MPKTMLEVKGLTKTFGPVKAVDNLSFTVQKGEVFGFLGPNGAGKTTTMRMITNFIPSTKGSVTIDGLATRENDIQVRQKIGYLPETTPLYGDQFVDEYLTYVATLRGLEGVKRTQQVEKMLTLCGLQSMRKRYVAHLSKGYRQRVGLAQALVHEPELLILDEPMSGLDPNQIVEIRALIKEIGKEKTVIYCSHILSEVAATCNRILIINEGKIVAQGTPDEVSADTVKKQAISLTLKKAPKEEALEKISAVPGVLDVQTRPEATAKRLALVVEVEDAPIVAERLFGCAVDNEWVLTELTPHETSLEDVFTELTRSEEE